MYSCTVDDHAESTKPTPSYVFVIVSRVSYAGNVRFGFMPSSETHSI